MKSSKNSKRLFVLVDIPITFYQKAISPMLHFLSHNILGLHAICRFSPTCSEYTKEAYGRYGIIQGTKYSLLRIIRCHPWSAGGFDPLPDKIKQS